MQNFAQYVESTIPKKLGNLDLCDPSRYYFFLAVAMTVWFSFVAVAYSFLTNKNPMNRAYYEFFCALGGILGAAVCMVILAVICQIGGTTGETVTWVLFYLFAASAASAVLGPLLGQGTWGGVSACAPKAVMN